MEALKWNYTLSARLDAQ